MTQETETAAQEHPELDKIVTVKVNLFQSDIDILRKIANNRVVTLTEALRYAIATENFMYEQAQEGNKFYLKVKDRPIMREVLWGRYSKFSEIKT